jgi:hypothetical protein
MKNLFIVSSSRGSRKIQLGREFPRGSFASKKRTALTSAIPLCSGESLKMNYNEGKKVHNYYF